MAIRLPAGGADFEFRLWSQRRGMAGAFGERSKFKIRNRSIAPAGSRRNSRQGAGAPGCAGRAGFRERLAAAAIGDFELRIANLASTAERRFRISDFEFNVNGLKAFRIQDAAG